jgi:GxxExxY protein
MEGMVDHDAVSRKVLGSAIEVHKVLGPGLLEGSYRACLLRQLGLDGLRAVSEVAIEVSYKGIQVPTAYRADVIVEDCVLVELKAVDRLLPTHDAQILAYLKHAGIRLGLLLNFNVPRLAAGIRRFLR